ncbi:hypothetical protein [Hyunsoonleella ulvae]|uniref:hypothetical protein n=1 Tax=Hyunsoonleella ulvae TaxID=2799948 RepID=UPI00193A9414|nr:hypothetical protein [Hyunsoonleella ulvae]
MKKILFILLIIPLTTTSQIIIKEGKFEKNKIPLFCNYLPEDNEIAVSYGSTIAISYNTKIEKIVKFNSDGKESIFYDGEPLMDPFWSQSGNTLRASKYNALTGGKKYLYASNKGVTEFRKYSNLKKTYFTSFFKYNDDYLIGFVNQKGSRNINLEKDELHLLKRNIFTDEVTDILIKDKPDPSEVLGKDLLKPNESNIFFKTDIVNDNKIQVITKSINNDYNVSNIYRRVYNLNGELIDKTKYNINLENGFFAY